MKFVFLVLTGLLFVRQTQAQQRPVDAIIRNLKDPASKNVLVAAHRGDWRNAPENSLMAIQLAVEMGVDIVEIDVQKTKDGHLVLMHDETINRTTNGKGRIQDYTLDSLQRLFLKNGLGRVTPHKIPTLEAAMLTVKGKAMVNLDKCYEYLPEAVQILEKTATLDHAIFKGYYLTPDQVSQDYSSYLNRVFYMSMVNLDKPGASQLINDIQTKIKPVAFELNFKQDTAQVLMHLADVKVKGSRIWVNSLWASLNGGHDDDMAVDANNPAGSWQWLLDRGATIIQTDRPRELLTYLKRQKLHH